MPEAGECRESEGSEEALPRAAERALGAGPGEARGARRPSGVRPWERLGSEPHPHMLLFRPRWDRLRNPRTGEILRRLVLETPDWVNVVALTTERRLVVVRQHRFGIARVTTEIPGGMVDRGETHGDAARRELREETGYTAARWTCLGAVEPNPAFHDNLCHHWLAEDAVCTHAQELDGGEDIQVATLGLDEVARAVRAGEIRHALVLTALSHVLDLRSGGPTGEGRASATATATATASDMESATERCEARTPSP